MTDMKTLLNIMNTSNALGDKGLSPLRESVDNDAGTMTLTIRAPKSVGDKIARAFELMDGLESYDYPHVTIDSRVVYLDDVQRIFKQYETQFTGFLVESDNSVVYYDCRVYGRNEIHKYRGSVCRADLATYLRNYVDDGDQYPDALAHVLFILGDDADRVITFLSSAETSLGIMSEEGECGLGSTVEDAIVARDSLEESSTNRFTSVEEDTNTLSYPEPDTQHNNVFFAIAHGPSREQITYAHAPLAVVHTALHTDAEDFVKVTTFIHQQEGDVLRFMLSVIIHLPAVATPLKDWLEHAARGAVLIDTPVIRFAAAYSQQEALAKLKDTPISEDYDEHTHDEEVVVNNKRCVVIGQVGDHKYRVKCDDGNVRTIDASEMKDIKHIAYESEGEGEGDGDEDEEVDLYERGYELDEILDKMTNLLRQAEKLVSGTPEQERARVYWIAHIKSALDADRYGYHAMVDMASTVNALMNSER